MPEDITADALWRKYAALEVVVAAMQPNFERLEKRIDTCESEGHRATERLEGKIEVLSRETHATRTELVQVQRTVSGMDVILDGLNANVIKIMTYLETMQKIDARSLQWKQIWVPALCGAIFGAVVVIIGAYYNAWFAMRMH